MTNKISVLALSLVAVALLLVTLGANGCQGSNSGSGFLIPDYAALKPDSLALKKCRLKLAGTDILAEIRQQRTGSQIELDLVGQGVTFEKEVYESDDKAFSVVDAGGERYEPAIPLIKYPMRVGDSWTWSGNLWYGSTPIRADAKIETSSEDLSVEGGIVHNAVRVEVTRSASSGRAESPSIRKLVFWIAKDKGVVKRAFGTESTREPVGP